MHPTEFQTPVAKKSLPGGERSACSSAIIGHQSSSHRSSCDGNNNLSKTSSGILGQRAASNIPSSNRTSRTELTTPTSTASVVSSTGKHIVTLLLVSNIYFLNSILFATGVKGSSDEVITKRLPEMLH